MSWPDGQNPVMKISVENKKSAYYKWLLYIKVTPIYNFNIRSLEWNAFNQVL